MKPVNCLRCDFRHKDNGNCTAVGGFCTAVAAAHCPMLREYLDTGLTPEEFHAYWAFLEDMIGEQKASEALDRFRQLVKADRDGRLVVLPCRVGHRVYVPDFEANTVANIRVQGVSITITGRVVLHFGGYPAVSVWGDRYGIDWFLTYEGAEAALRRAEK